MSQNGIQEEASGMDEGNTDMDPFITTLTILSLDGCIPLPPSTPPPFKTCYMNGKECGHWKRAHSSVLSHILATNAQLKLAITQQESRLDFRGDCWHYDDV